MKVSNLKGIVILRSNRNTGSTSISNEISNIIRISTCTYTCWTRSKLANVINLTGWSEQIDVKTIMVLLRIVLVL